jgi:hypothetical protein
MIKVTAVNYHCKFLVHFYYTGLSSDKLCYSYSRISLRSTYYFWCQCYETFYGRTLKMFVIS